MLLLEISSKLILSIRSHLRYEYRACGTYKRCYAAAAREGQGRRRGAVVCGTPPTCADGMQWLADILLEKLVGPYVTLKERKVDLLSGNVILRNVELREDVLDTLGLPVVLRGGAVGELEVSVPWGRLKTESVVVKLHGLTPVSYTHLTLPTILLV
eukprot:3992117-Pleurochrysis_carterae.AAC.1